MADEPSHVKQLILNHVCKNRVNTCVGFVSVYRDKINGRKQNAKRPKIKQEKMDFLFEKVAAFPRGWGYFTEKGIKRNGLQFSRKKFNFSKLHFQFKPATTT